MIQRLLIVYLVQTVSTTNASIFDCVWYKQFLNGQFTQEIHIQHSDSVQFSWSWVKGTSNITIRYTHHLEVNTSPENGVWKVNARDTSANSATKRYAGHGSILVSLLITFFCSLFIFDNNREKFIFLMVLCTCVIVFCESDDVSSCDKPRLQIIVPFEYINQLCVNNHRCFPVKCPLSFIDESSNVPSDNEILFSDNMCTIKKPDRWDEWIMYYFKKNQYTENYYLIDSDNDGLVNLLEYYGDINLFKGNNSTRPADVSAIGSNPNDPDSDNDLLLDGFEYSHGMSPIAKDDRNADKDMDGLSNLQEQIRRTDPTNPDSDGDGVNDGKEVEIGSDPLNPLQSQRDPTEVYAIIKLTIGDYSGSNSERYSITVGPYSHQAKHFGIVESGNYKFSPGNYTITVNHIDSNLQIPDYDYEARVSLVSGNVGIKIIDPSRLLGRHHESTYDFSSGKKATLIIASKEECSGCSCHKSCKKCFNEPGCIWYSKACINIYVPIKSRLDNIPFVCSCDKCKEWYDEEIKDTSWLDELNREFKCPCKAQLIGGKYMKEIDNPSNKTWKEDSSCTNPNSMGCKWFHDGAAGCIRSIDTTSTGAAQQCCYDGNGKLIKPGEMGAGTPDKKQSFFQHQMEDVITFLNCCKVCEDKSYCDLYINGVRKGDDSHCPK